MRARAGVAVAVVGLGVWLLTPQAMAQTQGPPTVSISATTPMSETAQCLTEPTTGAGSFTLQRSDTRGPLDVGYHIAGGPTDLNSDATAGADHTVTFADGQATVTVDVHPAIGGGSATVTLADGDSYDVGAPASATVDKTFATPSCPCPDLVSDGTQTVRVGETPDPVPVDGGASLFVASGAVPPGLTLRPDGTWTGTATRAGTFSFTVSTNCDTADRTVTVLSEELVRTGPTPFTVPLAIVGLGLVMSGISLRWFAGTRLR